MNRNMILECMYKVIKDSVEKGLYQKEYGHFVNGAVAMTEEMLKKAEIEDRCEKIENSMDKLSTILDAAKKYTDEYEYIEAALSDELSI